MCSAQDKTILENAYSTNPKPDKAARLDIVNRVTLNEKEVQVSLGLHSFIGKWIFGCLICPRCFRFGFKTAAKTTGGNRVRYRHKKSRHCGMGDPLLA